MPLEGPTAARAAAALLATAVATAEAVDAEDACTDPGPAVKRIEASGSGPDAPPSTAKPYVARLPRALCRSGGASIKEVFKQGKSWTVRQLRSLRKHGDRPHRGAAPRMQRTPAPARWATAPSARSLPARTRHSQVWIGACPHARPRCQVLIMVLTSAAEGCSADCCAKIGTVMLHITASISSSWMIYQAQATV